MKFKKKKPSSWSSRNHKPSCTHQTTRRHRKNIPNKNVIIIFLFLGAFATIFYFLAFSNYFQISFIEISGNKKTDSETIKNTVTDAMKDKSKYYIKENNYFAIDKGNIAKRLTEEFPQIKNVKIDKKFPNSIDISIEEKDSALIWCRDRCFFMNSQGIAFMEANEEQLIKENQPFIKIKEEAVLEEEAETGSVLAEKTETLDKKDEAKEANAENAETELQTLSEINANDKISDESFINFAIDINEKLSYNKRLKVKFYKTKGTDTRELIAFTDKNTRIYFDTTKDSETQVKNLSYFLNKELEQNQIDNLQYIYLKNQDRIFYK